jgi:hypothetical protein
MLLRKLGTVGLLAVVTLLMIELAYRVYPLGSDGFFARGVKAADAASRPRPDR